MPFPFGKPGAGRVRPPFSSRAAHRPKGPSAGVQATAKRRARSAAEGRAGSFGAACLSVARLGGLWLAVALLFFGCGRSEESDVLSAIRAKYPDGKPRCLTLVGAGIHVPVRSGGTLWYPTSGPTSLLTHLFVYWAGRSGDPVPELAADLAGRGVLDKVTVQATLDTETTIPGRRLAPGSSTPTIYEHQREGFPVDVYTTKPFDPAFGYARRVSFATTSTGTAGFPSRMYSDGPLPPMDRHYVIPTIDAYATSVVASACFDETADRVREIREKVDGFGDRYLEADVLFDERPRDWMLTRAFQRAAIGFGTDPITKPRLATIVLSTRGGTLAYVRELFK